MSVSAIWDRFWWSLMLALLVGLLWLKFIDPVFPYIIFGFLLSGVIGGSYFVTGIRKMRRKLKTEKEMEQNARNELIAEYGEGVFHD